MITRSFGANGQFEVVDWTEEVNVVPNQWGTIGQMGIFSEEPVAEHVVTFEEITKDGALIVDRVRGDRAQVGKDASRKLHTFAVPHFPYDDAISPQDLQGKRAYGKANEQETLEAVRARKMERIRQNHAWTLEFARAQAITAGTVYSPNGTVSQNWNTEFGVTRVSVDFLLGTGTTEVLAKIETGIAQIQDNTGGEIFTGTVVLTSPEFFAKLISHASVKAAYQYYTSTQEPLRNRLGGANALHRTFEYGGTKFVEMRDTYAGQRLIPSGKAYMVPTGTSNVFKTYFSPANRFGLVNTLGEQVYLFESSDSKGTKIELESESNFVNALLRPAMVVEFTSSN
jgi:hypothetical protein